MIKKEHLVALSIGLIVLGYVLDSLVNPLSSQISLPTPYHYFTPETIATYAFTSASIVFKALAIFLSLPAILAALDLSRTTKGVILIIASGLLQLYALQDVATGAEVVPLEWSVSLTLAGLLLLLPGLVNIILGPISRPKPSTSSNPTAASQ